MALKDRLLFFRKRKNEKRRHDDTPQTNRAIPEDIANVNWTVKDVLVGTVRTHEQLVFNMKNKNYYAPAKFIEDGSLPVTYIALFEMDIGTIPGIKIYGEVLTVEKIKRGKIPVSMRDNANPDELYYYFTVSEWEPLSCPIEILDSRRGRPRFTNKFLLEHCTKSYQLFAVNSESDYRLMIGLGDAFVRAEKSPATYRLSESRLLVVSDGYFIVVNKKREVLGKVSFVYYAANPMSGFYKIKKLME